MDVLPHQFIGRDFLVARQRAFLLDDVGLGKTMETIISHDQVQGKALILCESNKTIDWNVEYHTWAPRISRYLCSGSKSRRSRIYKQFDKAAEPAVLITNHHKLLHDLDFFLNMKFHTVVVDECEVFNNHDTQLFNHLSWVLRTRYYNWLLSAYPFGINLLQFYNLFELQGLGHLFGGRQRFMERFCVMELRTYWVKRKKIEQWVVTGAKNIEEFKQIAAPYCLRRTKASAGITTPPITFNAISCTPTPKQRQMYKDALRGKLVSASGEREFDPLSKYLFLTEILNTPWLIDQTDSDEAPKLDEVVKQFKKWNEKTVVFTQFKKWFPIIKKHLHKAGIRVIEYYGVGMSAKQKAKAEKAFKEASDPCVFLCTGAAKRGINLQHCHNLIVIDFEFNPVGLLQLFGRIDRLGQKHPMSISYIVAEGTHEERIFETLYLRQDLIDSVLGGSKAGCFDLEKLMEQVIHGI
jgi:SNF2 family DNA or RNA helicase